MLGWVGWTFPRHDTWFSWTRFFFVFWIKVDRDNESSSGTYVNFVILQVILFANRRVWEGGQKATDNEFEWDEERNLFEMEISLL